MVATVCKVCAKMEGERHKRRDRAERKEERRRETDKRGEREDLG